MKNKKIIQLISIVLVLLIALFVVLFLTKTEKSKINEEANQGVSAPQSTTWQEVDKNIVVPSSKEEAQNLGENVAKPQNVVKANANTDSNIRTFEGILIENNEFRPSEFRLKQGDVFDIFAKAVDKDYDITQPDYGVILKVKKGEQKRLQFQVTAPGKFVFYCSLCGGPDKGPKGYLVVVPK
jgi:nitrous oxide reductase